MIIPKVVKADAHGTEFSIPEFCPVCKAPVEIILSEKTGTETLHCTNPDCTAKHLQKYTRFVSKSGMDIDGLSIKTLVRFINEGYISDYADIFEIAKYKEQIVNLDGFGEKSYANLIASVEKSRHRHPANFLYALCIPMIGLDAAKKLISFYGTKGLFDKLTSLSSLNSSSSYDGFEEVDGIGIERSNAIIRWISQPANSELLKKLLDTVVLDDIAKAGANNGTCAGKTFVITGDVHIFKNRDAFKAYVEAQGGHVAGSVSGKTSYLVNNDINSGSSKNTKAKSLGIEIITEDTFVEMFGFS